MERAKNMPDITHWPDANTDSLGEEFLLRLDENLQKMALRRMAGERREPILNAVALVHEAWIQVEPIASDCWRDRKQFFASTADAIRRILMESARRRLAAKRSCGGFPSRWTTTILPAPSRTSKF